MRELVVSAHVFRVTGTSTTVNRLVWWGWCMTATSTTVADRCVQVMRMVHDSCKFPKEPEMCLGVKSLQGFNKEYCGLLNGIKLCFTGALVVIMWDCTSAVLRDSNCFAHKAQLTFYKWPGLPFKCCAHSFTFLKGSYATLPKINIASSLDNTCEHLSQTLILYRREQKSRDYSPRYQQKFHISTSSAVQREIVLMRYIGRIGSRRLYHFVSVFMPRLRKKKKKSILRHVPQTCSQVDYHLFEWNACYDDVQLLSSRFLSCSCVRFGVCYKYRWTWKRNNALG